jgi:hypothetical protein
MLILKQELIDNNYVFIDNFISVEEADKLYKGLLAYAKMFPDKFEYDLQCPLSKAIYNYRWFVDLLTNKTAFMSDAVGESVIPTYCYSRIYANGDVLVPHTDREACEISITVHLGNDGTPWPISFTKPNGEVVTKELKPGQGVIYLGCISTHWRDKYEGNEYGQVFMHYVLSSGRNWVQYFDRLNERNKQ